MLVQTRIKPADAISEHMTCSDGQTTHRHAKMIGVKAVGNITWKRRLPTAAKANAPHATMMMSCTRLRMR